jgi:polyribonucleotide nucleotidyltransferase
MHQVFQTDIAGKRLAVETGYIAQQAGGSVLCRYGDTVVLVTATASKEPREGIDFFPLLVDYEEKLYAVGKIPGGFIKREGRPGEAAILAALFRLHRPEFGLRGQHALPHLLTPSAWAFLSRLQQAA